MTGGRGRVAAALVVSEVFPPAIGGSGELLSNVYRRMGGIPVTVLTEGMPNEVAAADSGLHVLREPMSAPYWGLLRPAGLRHHLRRAYRLHQLAKAASTVIHCARALPEGLDARIAQGMGCGPYMCWAHGEEVAFTRTSRELRFLMARVHRNAAALIANSRNTASLLEAVGARPGIIEVVYPGVDATRFTPDAPGAAELRSRLASPGELLVLTVGRLQRRKGHDLVLEALAGLDRQTHPIRYVIVGDGDERTRLEALAASLNIADRVEFVGAVTPDQLPAYFAAADVFVHPNRVDGEDVEGFGIVFLEAAASGLPVIAGASGGAPEAVARDETGLLVSGTNVEEFRAALVGLALSPARRRAMGEAGRARAKRDFSWERAASQVADIHRRVAG